MLLAQVYHFDASFQHNKFSNFRSTYLNIDTRSTFHLKPYIHEDFDAYRIRIVLSMAYYTSSQALWKLQLLYL